MKHTVHSVTFLDHKKALCGVPLDEKKHLSYTGPIEEMASTYAYLESLGQGTDEHQPCPTCLNSDIYAIRCLDFTEL